MSQHLAFIKKASSRKIAELDEELQVNKNQQNEGVHLVDVRRKDKVIHDHDVVVHRVFVCSPDSGSMEKVGWVSNMGLSSCQLCHAGFGIFTGRHHCRACGNLICQHCSQSKTFLHGFENLGPLRTCTKCTSPDTVGPTVLRFSDQFGESLDPETARLEKLANAAENAPAKPTTNASAPSNLTRQTSSIATITNTFILATNAATNVVNNAAAIGVNTVSVVGNTVTTVGTTAISTITTATGLAPTSAGSEAPTPSASEPVAPAVEEPAAPVVPAAPAAPAAPVPVTVTSPLPGFIIKTKQTTGTKAKVFVNVYHHSSVEDVDLNLFQEAPPLASVGSLSPENPTAPAEIVPNMYVACAKSFTADKDGDSSELFNVVVNSEYFSESSIAAAVKISDAVCIQKILRVINKHYEVSLNEESYLFPKVRPGTMKGEVAASLECWRNTHAVDMIKTNLTRSDSFVSTSTSTTATGTGTSGKRRFTLNPTFSMLSISSQSESQRRSQRMSLFAAGRGKSESPVNTDASGDTTPNRRFTVFPSPSSNFDKAALLSPGMLVRADDQNISKDEVGRLKEESCENARALLGWQICVTSANGGEGEIYVITDLTKNSMRKTEYRLSALNQDDIWAKLRRSDAKAGLEFTPLRKVLFLGSEKQQQEQPSQPSQQSQQDQ